MRRYVNVSAYGLITEAAVSLKISTNMLVLTQVYFREVTIMQLFNEIDLNTHTHRAQLITLTEYGGQR